MNYYASRALLTVALFALAACGDDTSTDGGTDAGGDASDSMVDAGDTNVPDVMSDVVPPTCDLPIEGTLSLSDSVDATLSGESMNASTSCTSDVGAGGPEHYYELTITDTVGVEISSDAAFNTVVAIRSACDDPLSELGCGRSDDPMAPPGGPVGPAQARVVLEPGTYYVIVDTIGFGVGGDYTLTVTEFTPPTNSTCADAIAVTPDTALPDEDLDASASSAATCGSGSSNALYYEVTVPADSALQVSPMGVGPADAPSLEIIDECAMPTCLAESDFGGPVTYVNTSGADETVIVALRGTGRHSLAFETFTVPSHVTCAAPMTVTDGTTVSDERLAFGGTDPAACFPTPKPFYRSLYYTADVPAGEMLRVSAVPIGFGPGLTLSLVDGCAAGATCLASAGSAMPKPGSEGPKSLAWENTGASSATVILAVSGPEMERYDLNVTIGAPPVNDDCSMATAVTDGTSLSTELVTGATDTLGSACLPASTSPVVYYSASIPAGETLTVGAAPNGIFANASIRILSACGAASCLDSGAGSVAYTNSGAAAESVIIAVGIDADPTPPPGVTAPDSFALRVDIGFPPYTQSTITAACEDMTTATVLAGPTGDDSVSAVTAIPFAFEFFGDASTHYSVSSNGVMQIWPSSSGAPATEFNNSPIPTPGGPDGFIAPLWDDLFPGSVRTLTTGTAPNQKFTVEWTNFSFFYDRTASLTFQAQIYETTNVVELHHCTLTAGTEADAPGGGSATVGLEGPLGAVGAQHSFDTASSVDTTNGLRFTPM